MATKISWCDETWNPVTGCSPAGQGCQNCYAKPMFRRLAAMPNLPKYYGRTFDQVACNEDALSVPYQWSAPRSIFVNSMGDLFHKDVPFEFIHKVWAVMTTQRQHTYIVLTKRPERLREFMEWLYSEHLREYGERFQECESLKMPARNIIAGVSASNQREADRMVHELRWTRFLACRILSAEPLLSRMTLTRMNDCDTVAQDALRGIRVNPRTGRAIPGDEVMAPLDCVIVGGESGPGARPMHPDYARQLRDECKAAGTKFYFKSWGGWVPSDHDAEQIPGTSARTCSP